MAYEKGRIYARIEVDGTDYTHVLVSSTPPSIEYNLGETGGGRGASYPVTNEIQPLNFSFDVEGDFAELSSVGLILNISYTEELGTPGQATLEEVDYDIMGFQTSVVRSPFTARDTGLPVITHNLRVLRYKESRGDGEPEFDIDITTNPVKVLSKGEPLVPTSGMSASLPERLPGPGTPATNGDN